MKGKMFGVFSVVLAACMVLGFLSAEALVPDFQVTPSKTEVYIGEAFTLEFSWSLGIQPSEYLDFKVTVPDGVYFDTSEQCRSSYGCVYESKLTHILAKETILAALFIPRNTSFKTEWVGSNGESGVIWTEIKMLPQEVPTMNWSMGWGRPSENGRVSHSSLTSWPPMTVVEMIDSGEYPGNGDTISKIKTPVVGAVPVEQVFSADPVNKAERVRSISLSPDINGGSGDTFVLSSWMDTCYPGPAFRIHLREPGSYGEVENLTFYPMRWSTDYGRTWSTAHIPPNGWQGFTTEKGTYIFQVLGDGGWRECASLYWDTEKIRYRYTPVSGWVYNDENSNGLREESESGLAGLDLVLRNSKGQDVNWAKTDEFGSFKFIRILPRDVFTLRLQVPERYFATTTESKNFAFTFSDPMEVVEFGVRRQSVVFLPAILSQ